MPDLFFHKLRARATRSPGAPGKTCMGRYSGFFSASMFGFQPAIGLGALLLLGLFPGPAWNQEPLAQAMDFRQDALSSLGRELWAFPGLPIDPTPRSRAARISLFRMPTGFVNDPIGIVNSTDEDPAADNGPDDGDRSLQVSFGMHNPFFDLQRSGDPGGVGYYRLYGQYQLFDTGSTAICLGLQALTPAGLDADGVSQGPTILCPHVAWFQELGDGAALQGFVAKNFRANADTIGQFNSGIHYGMAVHYPVLGLCDESNRGLFFFVEGLGRYRYDSSLGPRPAATWEVVPGLHWRARDDFWISVGATRNGLFTASWRF